MNPKGQFMGTILDQRQGRLGGARSVFVKLTGPHDDLVFPTHGGQLMNPFAVAGKIFAGDLIEYRTDANGQNPVVYLLKTFEVKENVTESAKTVQIVDNGYRHVPSVGDVLMAAPENLDGTGTAATVTAVAKHEGYWTLTLSGALGAVAKGAILVEAVEAGASKKMLVKPNAFAPCDYDLPYAPAAGADDFEGARYFLTPTLNATTYVTRMSPIPACVLALNASRVNGWFRL